MPTMQAIRQYIKNTSMLWLAFLLPALLFMLSMPLHVHRHLDHQHDEAFAHHDHSSAFHKTHLSSTHDNHLGLSQDHEEIGVLAIDIPTKVLSKVLALILLACAFITLFVLLPPSSTGVLWLSRQERRSTVIRWRSALLPLRRAPPL